VYLDFWRRPNLFLGRGDPEIIGTDLACGRWDERQMTADKAFLDRGELRLVCLDVDVDVDILQLADVLAVAIHQHLAVPLGDIPFGLVFIFGHRSLLLLSRGSKSDRPLSPMRGCSCLADRKTLPMEVQSRFREPKRRNVGSVDMLAKPDPMTRCEV